MSLPGPTIRRARAERPRARIGLIVVAVGTVAAIALLFGVHFAGVLFRDDGPRTLHVSPNGDDAGSGLSPETAWRSLARADAERLRPGDQLLLEGGSRLSGSLSIGPGEAGDASRPVVIGSYGVGRAVIAAAGAAVTVYNTAGVEVRDLLVKGDASAYADASGVKAYSDLPGERRLDGITIAGVEATGFRIGIEVGAAPNAAGFRNVTVRDSVVHGNMEVGLLAHGSPFDVASPRYSHETVKVVGVEAYGTPGDPRNRTRNTGSGIVFGSVRDGLIERSSAHDNGSLAKAPEGPVGIWAYDSTRVVIQKNISYRNHTAGRYDGGGFDFDQNVSASVLQYNYSHDNDGAGYMFYSAEDNGAHRGNTIRYNVSSDDGRRLSIYGGISLAGYVHDVEVYHNTVIARTSGTASAPAIRVRGEHTGVAVRNNVLVSDGTALVLAAPYPPDQVRFQGNLYFARSGPWAVGWGATVHSSLPSWRAGTGQERVAASDSGITADPRLGTTDVGGTDGSFVPRADSPVIGRALDLKALFGTDPGTVDYLGRPVTGPTAVGAVEPFARR